jgi:proteic killer suppression protein
MAEKLKHRLADLEAATCVTDLVAGRPRQLEGGQNGQFAVDLGQDSSIVFCANHNAIPLFKSGAVNWSKVSRVKILRIGKEP